MRGCCAGGYSKRDNKPEDNRERVLDPHYVEDQEQNQIVFLEDAIHHDRKDVIIGRDAGGIPASQQW